MMYGSRIYRLDALAVAALLAATAFLMGAGRPNVVLIMADDMGYECVGANGSTFYDTPNLDRLAAEGARFEHAYSQPVCTPSRVQIMTGRYNFRNYTGFAAIHPDEVSFGSVMQRAGYRTCIAGKWQLDGGMDGPTGFGFDEYCLWQLTRRPSRYEDPGLEVNGKEVDYPGKYGPDVISDYLIDFMKRSGDEPFFAYYPMVLPHFPFHYTPDVTQEDRAAGAAMSRDDRVRDQFRGMVAYADKMVGKIDAALEEMGIRENTLLIFTCDNGTKKGIASPFRGGTIVGGKGTTPDAGTHVPFIASWPGTIAPGQVRQELVDFTDLLPTLAELGGGEPPADRVIDGRSILPLLTGPSGEQGSPREWVYCWYQRDGKRDGSVKRFARNQTYKLYDGGQLYNIPSDGLERHPLEGAGLDDGARQVRDGLEAVIESLGAQENDFTYSVGPVGGGDD